MKKLKLFMSMLLCLAVSYVGGATLITPDNFNTLSNGSYISLQCRDTQGGGGSYFNGGALKSSKFSSANLFQLVSCNSGYVLKNVVSGNYVANNFNTISMTGDITVAAEFTLSIKGIDDFTYSSTTVMDGTVEDNLVRFISGTLFLNTNDSYRSPRFYDGTGGSSVWYVHSYTSEEVEKYCTDYPSKYTTFIRTVSSSYAQEMEKNPADVIKLGNTSAYPGYAIVGIEQTELTWSGTYNTTFQYTILPVDYVDSIEYVCSDEEYLIGEKIDGKEVIVKSSCFAYPYTPSAYSVGSQYDVWYYFDSSFDYVTVKSDLQDTYPGDQHSTRQNKPSNAYYYKYCVVKESPSDTIPFVNNGIYHLKNNTIYGIEYLYEQNNLLYSTTDTDLSSAYSKWRIITNDDGYYVQNIATGRYISSICGGQSGFGLSQMTTQETPEKFYITRQTAGSSLFCFQSDNMKPDGLYMNAAGWGSPVGTYASQPAGTSGWEFVKTTYFNLFITDLNDKTVEAMVNTNDSYSISDNIKSIEITETIPAVNLTYTRNFTDEMAGNWQAWFMPFDVDYDDMSEKYDVAQIYGVLKDNAGDVYVAFQKMSEGLVKANVPYVVRAKEAGDAEITATTTLQPTADAKSFTIQSAYNNYTLGGVYKNSYLSAEQPTYSLNKSGDFAMMASDVYLRPFRIYMRITDREDNPYAAVTSPEVKVVVLGEDETSIEEIHNSQFIMHNDDSYEIYNIAGQKLQKLRKGINIVNGKKVLF